jgi:predicted DNA-binding transcriptional regulator AlpA
VSAPVPPTLPTPGELATADLDELRSMLTTDRALSLYFAARADVVAEALARRARVADPPGDALAVDQVVAATGMSRQWLYREARAGRLPFAGKIGRRITFDAAGLRRWLARRRA